jgi:microcystin-dependent protein
MDPIIGQIQAFGFSFTPKSWQACNGQLIPIQQNTALFSLLGTYYGGNGTTTFALPDLRGRSMVGIGNGPGLTPIVIGQNGGAENATLTTANLPAHTHNVSVGVNTAAGEEAAPTFKIASSANSFSEDKTGASALGGLNQLSQGQNQSFDMTAPYLVLNVCVSTQGIYPSRN